MEASGVGCIHAERNGGGLIWPLSVPLNLGIWTCVSNISLFHARHVASPLTDHGSGWVLFS